MSILYIPYDATILCWWTPTCSMLKNHRYYPVVRIPSCHDQGGKVIASFLSLDSDPTKFYLIFSGWPQLPIFYGQISHHLSPKHPMKNIEKPPDVLFSHWLPFTRCFMVQSPIPELFHRSTAPRTVARISSTFRRRASTSKRSEETMSRTSGVEKGGKIEMRGICLGHFEEHCWGKTSKKLGPMASLVFPFEDKPHAVRTCRKWWLEPDGLYLNMNPARMLKKTSTVTIFLQRLSTIPNCVWMDLLGISLFFQPINENWPNKWWCCDDPRVCLLGQGAVFTAASKSSLASFQATLSTCVVPAN